LSRMFSFVTVTWNPIGGECSHKCVGCWARAYAERLKFKKYQGQPRIDEKQINRRFKKGDFVFVQDMTDLFADNVPREVILRVLDQIGKSSDAKFLLLTKNPKRYYDVLPHIPENCVLGATIESNRIEPRISKAQDRYERIHTMLYLREMTDFQLFVSVEPIMDFGLETFCITLGKWLRPWAVAVGYDNYGNGFPEPPLSKTMQLINKLESVGIKVYRKTLREALRG